MIFSVRLFWNFAFVRCSIRDIPEHVRCMYNFHVVSLILFNFFFQMSNLFVLSICPSFIIESLLRVSSFSLVQMKLSHLFLFSAFLSHSSSHISILPLVNLTLYAVNLCSECYKWENTLTYTLCYSVPVTPSVSMFRTDTKRVTYLINK